MWRCTGAIAILMLRVQDLAGHHRVVALGKLLSTYRCVPLSSSSIIWYQPKVSDALWLGR